MIKTFKVSFATSHVVIGKFRTVSRFEAKKEARATLMKDQQNKKLIAERSWM